MTLNELRAEINACLPLPLALSRSAPLAGARSVIEIAAGYHKLAGGAPADDKLLAALYSYINLRPRQRELALLLNLIRNQPKEC